MSPAVVLLVLRGLLAVVAYGFLGLVLLWQIRELGTVVKPAAPPPAARLMVEAGPELGSAYPLAAVNLLGRATDNTITIPDATVSSYHARLSFHAGQWWLEDLGSRNGTYVNGLALHGPLVVTFDDEIRLGEVRLRLMRGERKTEPAIRPPEA
jgi:hypothetical protein